MSQRKLSHARPEGHLVAIGRADQCILKSLSYCLNMHLLGQRPFMNYKLTWLHTAQ
jgi:hypothetical protein